MLIFLALSVVGHFHSDFFLCKSMVLVGQFAARQLCVGLGYIYPLYASVEALRTRREQELLQWITFWTVNAIFWVAETVGDTVISWVPFYLEAKIVALAWLVLPSYRGALLLHQKWLAPAFQQHEQVIDFTIADLKRRAGEKMVQVCKDTAVIALRNSSDVVAQSQQFAAAQLVQQALGKLQHGLAYTTPSDNLRQPSLLTDLTFAESKIDVSASRAEEKEPTISKKQAKGDCDTQEKATTLSRTEKAKQVLDHFKKLMVKGFQLKYHPSAGVVKHRALLLESSNSRYVSFMSARDTGSVDSKKKAARLLLHNLRRVSASVADECALFANMVEEEEVDASVAFILDNGKAVMLFEAESQKNRDLLVAGLRLLITEHKKRDTVALNKLCSAVERIVMQQAFMQLRATAERPFRK
ncbi:TB2/DP1 HVA22 family [Phytophthora infestans]|uniref:TB2/DP1 HVA22 family n=1 Tax=Phytophthora infestans TaxID=4787 RepID=A0A8S9TX67_PHYIN|nr:TB2/DP1 HVA22 family [Phytophthora infestans]